MSDEVAEKHKKPMWRHAAAFSQRIAEKVKIDGGVIGRASLYAGGGRSAPFTAIRLGFGVDVVPNPISWKFVPAVFRRHAITPADVGKSFYEDANTDPMFTKVVSGLTNGVDDIAFLFMSCIPDDGSGGGSGVQESDAFKGSELPRGIDFAGQQIARLGLRVDALKFYVDEDPLEGQQPACLFDGEFTILVEKPWQTT